MSEYEKKRLGELIEIKHGFGFEGQYFVDDGPYILLTPGNFTEGGGFRSRGDKQKYYDGPVPSEFVLKPRDILVAMTEQGEGLLGSTAIVPDGKPCLHNQRLGLIRARPEAVVDLNFIYYLFNSRLVRAQIRATSSGAKVRHTSPARIYEVVAPIPDATTQRRIASILGAYDDLIEVNRQRIALLEEMSRRLFEEWFIQFRFPGHEGHAMVQTPNGPLPDGWRHGALDDVVEQRRDTTSPGEHLSARVYVPIECIGRRTLALSERRPFHEAQSSLQLFERDDILFGAMRAYFHKVCPAPMAGVTRSTCFVLRPRNPSLFAFATLALFRDETVAFAAANSKGSTIPYAHWAGSLERLPIAIPRLELLKRFDDHVRPMLRMIMNACETNRHLEASRDLLLPRLVAGDLSLSAAERELEAVA